MVTKTMADAMEETYVRAIGGVETEGKNSELVPENNAPLSSTCNNTTQEASNILGTPNQAVEDKEDEVKANKNKLNLEPAMNFIKANKEECNSALDRLRKSYNGPISGDGIYSLKIGKSEIGIKIVGSNLIGENKGGLLTPRECMEYLGNVPEILLKLIGLNHSDGVKINYNTLELLKNYSSERVNLLPLPIYDEEGNFTGGAVSIELKDFPRKNGVEYGVYNSTGKVTVQATKDDEENDENHRILIGISNKNTIYPTPLPLSISKGNSDKGDSEAVKFYQVAVLLHEFFHTFESNFRNSTSGDRGKIELIDSNGIKYTLEEWWQEFKEYVLSDKYKFPSRYASTYEKDLNAETQANSKVKFNHALAEQMAEMFAGYKLGILTPPDKNEKETNFEKRAGKGWELMKKLCESTLVPEVK